MNINKVVLQVNRLLGDELYPYSKLEQFLDAVVDEINDNLSACFPVFSDVVEDPTKTDVDYDCFPDKYIREVVIKGAAYKFLIQDEEGIPTATQYGYEYKDAMFVMLRDYAREVPAQYDVDHIAAVDTSFEDLSELEIDPILTGWWL